MLRDHHDKSVCPICGGKKEQPGARTCYGCYLDGLVPPGYGQKEEYAYDSVWGKWNAKKRPKTGVEILDLPRPPKLSDTWLRREKVQRLCEIERKMM